VITLAVPNAVGEFNCTTPPSTVTAPVNPDVEKLAAVGARHGLKVVV